MYKKMLMMLTLTASFGLTAADGLPGFDLSSSNGLIVFLGSQTIQIEEHRGTLVVKRQRTEQAQSEPEGRGHSSAITERLQRLCSVAVKNCELLLHISDGMGNLGRRMDGLEGRVTLLEQKVDDVHAGSSGSKAVLDQVVAAPEIPLVRSLVRGKDLPGAYE